MDKQSQKERAKRILTNNLYMILATSQNNKAWSTPVFYAFDQQNFYWYSRKNTRHSLNILVSPEISASIFGVNNEDEGFGVYIEGKAFEVAKNELKHALDIYAQKAAKNAAEKEQLTTIEDFINDSPLRMYKLIPEKVYVSNKATKWKGKWIDSKSEIVL